MDRQLTENQILEGLRQGDSEITRIYFYGYCRVAYYIYDQRYHLSSRPDMDFYSLTHEYYISLITHNWRQLENRKSNVSLKTWIVNGFRFVILDALKTYERNHRIDSLEERVARGNLSFDVPEDHFHADFMKEVDDLCSVCYHDDLRAQTILRMMLVEGYSGKETAEELNMTPSAVSQRYRSMMRSTVLPYFRGERRRIVEMQNRLFEDQNADSVETNLFTNRKRDRSIIPHDSYFSEDAEIVCNSISISREPHYSPSWITELRPNQIFVFGSNIAGLHLGGAARTAYQRFGAIMGQADGLQGQSYAIPSMQGSLDKVIPYIDDFIFYAQNHQEYEFLVTRVGCGVAGFDVEQMAPLFRNAFDKENILLPKDFCDYLEL